MQPAEVFFYVFLPPLLLDSAVRVDFFLFKKVLRTKTNSLPLDGGTYCLVATIILY